MLSRLLIALALATVVISSSGCAGVRTKFMQDPLPVPERPELPKVGAASLACLSDEAYEALAKRDALQAAHIRLLEVIILTTH